MASFVNELIEAIETHYNADVYVYIGDMKSPVDIYFLRWVKKEEDKKKNAILILKTLGGSPDAAYRIARYFQKYYNALETDETKKGIFYVFIAGECKSAGTLLAIGGNILIMNNASELGPLDVQLRKQDEVGERTSGLAPLQSLGTLKNQAIEHFKELFYEFRFSLQFSTKIASEIATNMTVGLLSPIYGQIDPIRMAEIERSMNIAAAYGERLTLVKNLKDGALGKLLANYPSHGFVIDHSEANDLFHRVEQPLHELEKLSDFFSSFTDDSFSGKKEPFAMPVKKTEEADG